MLAYSRSMAQGSADPAGGNSRWGQGGSGSLENVVIGVAPGALKLQRTPPLNLGVGLGEFRPCMTAIALRVQGRFCLHFTIYDPITRQRSVGSDDLNFQFEKGSAHCRLEPQGTCKWRNT